MHFGELEIMKAKLLAIGAGNHKMTMLATKNEQFGDRVSMLQGSNYLQLYLVHFLSKSRVRFLNGFN